MNIYEAVTAQSQRIGQLRESGEWTPEQALAAIDVLYGVIGLYEQDRDIDWQDHRRQDAVEDVKHEALEGGAA